ncbi:MAG TPA: hypothetical protein VJX95_02205 [Oscillospiraceae bacterium]|nr:hypothetical protein [Oscillospiraceae bacterium]
MAKHNKKEKSTTHGNAFTKFFSDRFTFGVEGNWRRTEAYIVGAYLLAGALWIVSSDSVVKLFFTDAESITKISIIKGWAYVVLTALLLYLLIHSATRKMDCYRHEMNVNYKKLKETVEKLECMNKDLSVSEEVMRHQRDKLLFGQKRISEKNRLHIALLELIDDCILEFRGESIYFSDHWINLSGYSREFLLQPENWAKVIQPDDIQEIITRFPKNQAPLQPTGNLECIIITSSGEKKRLLNKYKSWYDEIDECWITIVATKEIPIEANT